MTNEGNVTLNDVVVTDLVGGVTVVGGPTTLDVGESDTTTFTGSYQITQADVDAGHFSNTAEANSEESGPDEDDEDVDLPQNAALSIVKTGAWVDGDDDGFADVGETINYTFTVTNEGNVTLPDVVVTDLVGGVTVVGGPTTLDVGETTRRPSPAATRSRRRTLTPGTSPTRRKPTPRSPSRTKTTKTSICRRTRRSRS